jgi:hypothetical protein
MTQRIILAFTIVALLLWTFFLQRQLNLVTTKLAQPAPGLKAAEIQLEAVKLAESNRQKAREEEEAQAKVLKTEREG